MIRDQKAFDKARAKEQRELDAKIAVAVKNLPHIVATKHDGRLRAASRAELHTTLISDGVLGGEWMARHIAHAVKHNMPLPQHQQEMAGIIIDTALRRVNEAGHIELPNTLEIRVPIVREITQDPDERYVVSQLLPRQRAERWNLRFAHDT